MSLQEDLNTKDTKSQDDGDITNLTAQIQTFVRIADTDKETLENEIIDESKEHNIQHRVDAVEKNDLLPARKSPESNEFYPQECYPDEITFEKIQNLGEINENCNEKCEKSQVKILIRAPTEEETALNIDDPCAKCTEIETNNVYENQNTSLLHTISEKDENSEDKHQEINMKTNIEYNENLKIPDQSETALKLDEDMIAESKSDPNLKMTELKITEYLDDLTEGRQIQTNETEQMIVSMETNSSEKMKSPLCSETFDIKNDGEIKKLPTPPVRRRSVREIIESINNCQKLLKVNQEVQTNRVNNMDSFQTSTSSSKTFGNENLFTDRNMNDVNKKDYQNKRLFTKMTEVNNNAKSEEMCIIPLFVERFNEFNNNNSNVLFERCIVNNDEKGSNIESRWNPVPKPRRHRNSTK